MAKTEKTAKPAVKTEEKTKRPYHRQMPIGYSKNRGERLKPILHSLIERNMSVTELAEKLGMTRQGLNLRFAKGDCNLSDMEAMAEALGYKFDWTWTKIGD